MHRDILVHKQASLSMGVCVYVWAFLSNKPTRLFNQKVQQWQRRQQLQNDPFLSSQTFYTLYLKRRHRPNAVWYLSSSKSRLECFVAVAKRREHFNDPAFPFFGRHQTAACSRCLPMLSNLGN